MMQITKIGGSAQQQKSNYSQKQHFEILRNLSGSTNFVFSPLSISLVLSMAALGSSGLTKESFLKYFELKSTEQIAGFAREMLASMQSKNKGVLTLMANKLYHSLPQLGADFSNLMTTHFKSTIENMPFNNNPEAARVQINKDVKTLTQDKISDILPAGSISAETQVVLVNAMYFNGRWNKQFDRKKTNFGVFNLAYNHAGQQVKVPLMEITSEFEYYKGNGFEYIQIPYEGKEYVMEVILPADNIEVFEKNFEITSFSNSRAKMRSSKVRLVMPKFRIGDASSKSLKEVLIDLGLGSVFSHEAQFELMDPSNSIRVNDVFHKAVIEVTEEGTEASAATAATMLLSKSTSVELNKPFFYAITHVPTQTLLFLGKLTDPSQQ